MKSVIILVLLVILLCNIMKNRDNFINEPCSDKLTDKEYLLHMIPHHQVAVDISIELQKMSKWPKMQEILRKLIWVQNYEIGMMNEMLKKFPNKMTDETKMQRLYKSTVSDFTKPNKLGLTKTYCDPHFFDPEEHMKHIKHMKLDDKMYLEHMIPHHQVAVDMSKKLLKNTKNDFMIELAYRIIRSQQEEIILLNDLLKEKNNKYKSDLVL
jgi:uncharacterized protein (DUF305 family)